MVAAGGGEDCSYFISVLFFPFLLPLSEEMAKSDYSVVDLAVKHQLKIHVL